MRISDRSSDVCSSGLVRQEGDTRDGADNTCEIEDDADARAIEQAGALDGKSKDRDLKEPKAKPRERRSNPDLFSSPVGRQIPAEPGSERKARPPRGKRYARGDQAVGQIGEETAASRCGHHDDKT